MLQNILNYATNKHTTFSYIYFHTQYVFCDLPIKNSCQDLAKNLDKIYAKCMYKNLVRFIPKNGTRVLQDILLKFMQ